LEERKKIPWGQNKPESRNPIASTRRGVFKKQFSKGKKKSASKGERKKVMTLMRNRGG